MKKAFDCVEMKNRLQAELREQEQRLGAEEIRRRRQQWLATGEDGLARGGGHCPPKLNPNMNRSCCVKTRRFIE